MLDINHAHLRIYDGISNSNQILKNALLGPIRSLCRGGIFFDIPPQYSTLILGMLGVDTIVVRKINKMGTSLY